MPIHDWTRVESGVHTPKPDLGPSSFPTTATYQIINQPNVLFAGR